MPKNNNNVIGGEPIVVICVRVVPFDQEPVHIDCSLLIGVELGENKMKGHIFMLVSDLGPLNQQHS